VAGKLFVAVAANRGTTKQKQKKYQTKGCEGGSLEKFRPSTFIRNPKILFGGKSPTGEKKKRVRAGDAGPGGEKAQRKH